MIKKPHISGLSAWPDLVRDYDNAWRAMLRTCPQGCDGPKITGRYERLVAERRSLTVAPPVRRR